jgi:hypothetical protein
MNRTVLAGAASLLAMSATGVSFAQETAPKNVSFRIGAAFPTHSDTRDIAKTVFAAGIEFKFLDLKQTSTDPSVSGGLSVSLDYYGRDRFSNVPLLVNYVGRSNQFFFSLGAGISFIRYDNDGTDFNRTRFGYQVGIGYDFNTQLQTPLFLELKYFGSSENKANAIGAYLGVRF